MIKRSAFVVLPAALLRQRLSLRAIGLAAHIEAVPEEEFGVAELEAQVGEGDLTGPLAELERAGFFQEDAPPPREASPVPQTRPSKMRHVYVLACGQHFKIGIATNPRDRIAGMQIGNPIPIELIYSQSTTDAETVEAHAHQLLQEFRTTGEWFSCSRDAAINAVKLALAVDAGIEGA